MQLKRIMKDKAMSANALSYLSGVPVRTIEDAIKRDSCRVSTLCSLADALGVSMEEIVNDPLPESVCPITGNWLFTVNFKDKMLVSSSRIQMISIIDLMINQDKVSNGDYFIMTLPNGDKFTMVCDTTYGYVDCISRELIGPTMIQKRSPNDDVYPNTGRIAEFLTSYYFRETPPALKNITGSIVGFLTSFYFREIPAALKNIITPKTLISEKEKNGSLWIPFANEVGILDDNDGPDVLQYATYAGNDSCRVKTLHGIKEDWWTYSPADRHSKKFQAVSTQGKLFFEDTNVYMGVPLCFRIREN